MSYPARILTTVTISSITDSHPGAMTTAATIACSRCPAEEQANLTGYPTDNAIRGHFATIGWGSRNTMTGKPADVCPNCRR